MNIINRERLDYSQKGTWTEQNIDRIASNLGYALNDRFRSVFGDFVKTTVAGAKLTDFLLVIAQSHFGKITPPLEKA